MHETQTYKDNKIQRLEKLSQQDSNRIESLTREVELLRSSRDRWRAKAGEHATTETDQAEDDGWTTLGTIDAPTEATSTITITSIRRPAMQPDLITHNAQQHEAGHHDGTTVWTCYACQVGEML